MKISALYIAKNEEENIRKSIENLGGVIDEIIVVDTGSTDNTIKICKELGCTVYEYEWEFDFAKARNYAISKANNEIILFLDCDEYFSTPLTEDDKEKIINYFEEDKEIDTLCIKMINIDKKTNLIFHEAYNNRIFRKMDNIYYTSSIHENLHKENGEMIIALIQDIELIHTGYSSEVQELKPTRNLEILKKIKNPTAMELFYLVRENLSLKNFKEAEHYNILFENHKDKLSVIEGTNIGYLYYLYKAMIIENSNKKDKKKEILQVLRLAEKDIPTVPELYYNLGMFYMNYDFDIAEEYLSKTLKTNLEFNNSADLRLNNFKSFEPEIYYNLAKIYYFKNDKNSAIQKAMVAYMLNRRNKKYLNFVLKIFQRKNYDKNVDTLLQLCGVTDKSNLERLVQCLANTNLDKEFCTFAAEYNKNHDGNDYHVLYAMLLSSHFEDCINLALNFNSDVGNFVATVGILFSNDTKIYAKYIQSLPQNYQNIINVFIQGYPVKNLSEEDRTICCLVVARLFLLGVKQIPDNIKFSIYKAVSPQQLKQLINVYNVCGEYGLMMDEINLYQHIHKTMYKDFVSDCLHGLIITCKHREFIKLYDDYYKRGFVNKNENFIGLLKLAKLKLTEDDLRIKEYRMRDLGDEFFNA